MMQKEIRTSVLIRSLFPGFRACVEDLITHNPWIHFNNFVLLLVAPPTSEVDLQSVESVKKWGINPFHIHLTDPLKNCLKLGSLQESLLCAILQWKVLFTFFLVLTPLYVTIFIVSPIWSLSPYLHV